MKMSNGEVENKLISIAKAYNVVRSEKTSAQFVDSIVTNVFVEDGQARREMIDKVGIFMQNIGCFTKKKLVVDKFKQSLEILYVLRQQESLKNDFKKRLIEWLDKTCKFKEEQTTAALVVEKTANFFSRFFGENRQDSAKRSLRHNLRQDFLTR
jgi:hypothetical protein